MNNTNNNNNNNKLNKYKYPGAKRLMLEAQELKDNTEDYCAQPLDDNLFEWHFTLRGPPDTAFDGGYYHGRLSFPTEYPMKPPSIILLTPNGRFETNKKICLSISGFHPETWQPSWSVRTALLALIAFMPTKANRAIGSLDYSDTERRRLALKSRTWRCETCGLIKDLLIPPGGHTSLYHRHPARPDDSKPGTSRASEASESDSNSSDEQRSTQSTPSTSDNSDISSSSEPMTSTGSTPPVEQASQEETAASAESGRHLAAPDSNNRDPQEQSQSQSQPQTGHNTQRGTVCSPLVLKSILALLLLLIVRRIVMVIQS